MYNTMKYYLYWFTYTFSHEKGQHTLIMHRIVGSLWFIFQSFMVAKKVMLHIHEGNIPTSCVIERACQFEHESSRQTEVSTWCKG